MVIVNFEDENYKRVTGLWQWDYGQVLRIQGLNLPKAVEIHFSLQESGGQSVTRIGMTKDGVTDVVIPDSMLENEESLGDYDIYAFIYLTDDTSGQTECKICMPVKARPKPEAFDKPEDEEIFQETITAVNESAERAESAEQKVAQHAEQTKADAQKTTADRQEVEKLVESVSGIGEQVQAVKDYKEQAQTAATNALLSEQKSEQAKEAALRAQAGAETAADEAEQHALDTAGDKTEVERLATQVRQDKTSVEQTAQGFGNTVQQAEQSINTAKTQAVETVNATKTDAVKAVQTAAQEIIADREQIQENKTGIAKLKEDIDDLIYKYQENNGYVGYDSGIIYQLEDTKCTDFLPIKKGMTVKVSGISFEPSDYRGLAIYDKDKIFKNGYQYSKNNEYTFNVSEDGYLRATIVGQQIKVIANQNGIVKALIEVSEDTQKEIKREVNTLISEEYGEEKQLEITETKEGYAVKSDGSKENAGWISCLKFNCEAYQKIYTKNAHSHANYPWIVLYDSNNNVIKSVNMNEDFSAEVIAPYNVSYGWMNCYELVSYAQTQYLIRTIKNEYLPEKLKKIITESNPLANLLENGGYTNIFNKISCIGDSLTEGVFEYTENGEVKFAGKPQGLEPYSYPSQLARMINATVGNYGVGGATAKSWLETTACTDCFKEENKAQAYIIALGTNDTNYDGDVNADIDASNYNNNADTFVGNYAKIIQKCLELQPKAKIFVVTIPKTRTNYHNAWTTGNNQIKAIAKKLGVYVLDVFTYSESYDNPDEYKKHFYTGGHRNSVGYKRTAMEYATYISWIIYNNPNDFRNAQFIGMDYEFIN